MTASKRVKGSTAENGAAKRAAKTARTKRGTTKPPSKTTTPKATLASVSKQITKLSEKLDKLGKLLRESMAARSSLPERASQDGNGTHEAVDAAGFDLDLLNILAELDRRGRHDGLVPIPEVRDAFLERGWTRRTFDDRLLQAERDFVVDLKTADDPKHLTQPDLSIRERGRGHLQYVVVR